jgi:hypothetical protein
VDIIETIRRWLGLTSRTEGLPTSPNGASSFHLFWEGAGSHVTEVSATLTIVEPPRVNRLYFWALQASFADAAGTKYGGAHLGLQWHDGHPGHTAANWGGYRPEGGELAGSESPLPSTRGNLNTRDFAWVPGRPYRLTIRRADDDSGWAGLVDGVALRVLHAGGDRLTGPMVWSEVFARCDDPTVVVQWSDFEVRGPGGTARPRRVRVNYQAKTNGGCDNTTVEAAGDGFRQVTNAPRAVAGGTELPVPP